ncbi:MAG: DUF924 family protein [Burkholderiales bacterium]
MQTPPPLAESPASISQFWFGDLADAAQVAAAQSSLWWGKNPAQDAEVHQRFAPSMQAASRGELDGWLLKPPGRLALILLADQFTRMAWRDTPQAFALDPLALHWSQQGVALGQHHLLRPIEQVFFYMPLMHAEALADQAHCITLFTALVQATPAAQRATFQRNLDFAQRHHAIIARFGRFPHRNLLLGRASTVEELAFLQEPGSSF